MTRVSRCGRHPVSCFVGKPTRDLMEVVPLYFGVVPAQKPFEGTPGMTTGEGA